MYFNFKLFSVLTAKAYNNVGDSCYSLEEVLSVFEYYFKSYEDTFQEVHPPIRMAQIQKIIQVMPYIDREHGHIADIDSKCYEAMIDKHFETQYKCDYNINHFFSGDIRMLRYYEELY